MKSAVDYYLDFEDEFLKEQLRSMAQNARQPSVSEIGKLRVYMMRLSKLRLIASATRSSLALYLTSSDETTRKLAELRAEELELQDEFEK